MRRPHALVFDAETTIRNYGSTAVGDFRASPFHPDNEIVCLGYRAIDLANGEETGSFVTDEAKYFVNLLTEYDKLDPEYHLEMLVGINVKFDILHLYALDYERVEPVIRDKIIWDCQFVEYLITGQQVKFASMNQMAEKYGGTQKPDKIKEYWDAGIDTSDIPRQELHDYQKGDVDNTMVIFKAQLEKVHELEMFGFVLAQLEALKATIEMEWNGVFLHQETLDVDQHLLEEAIARETAGFQSEMTALCQESVADSKVFNPMSADHLRALIYGGVVTAKVSERLRDEDGNPLFYKSGLKKGEPKYGNVEKPHSFGITTVPVLERTPKGAIAVNEGVLKALLESGNLSVLQYSAVARVLRIRAMQKELSTYVIGYGKLRWPNDGCLHANYTHVQADTGRLACSKPNIQNISKKEVEDV